MKIKKQMQIADAWKRKMMLAAVGMGVFLFAFPAGAFHPLSTDDPGTTEHRHFELEWGNDGVWEDGDLVEVNAYLAIKGGLLPGLEFDTALNYVYWLDAEGEDISGWSDAEILFKYRFLGDGDGPNNLGVEAVFVLPSGESRKGLSEGDEIIPTIFLFGSVGRGAVRVLFNVGYTWLPHDLDVIPAGLGLEWALSDKFSLVGEVFTESDFRPGHDNDATEALAGFLYSPADNLTLSLGAGRGVSEDASDFHLTFAALLGW